MRSLSSLGGLTFFLTVFAVGGSLLWSQTAKTEKAAGAADISKAHAWAETVTDFIASPEILKTFPTADKDADVRQVFKALVPPEVLIMNNGGDGWGSSFLGNPEKGVARLEYELSHDGGSKIWWVTIYMPRTDPGGVDVLSRVVGSLRRKLRRPWIGIHRPGNSYIWEQREARLLVIAEIVDNMPKDTDDGAPTGQSIRGSWVWVSFGHVEAFHF